MGIEIIRVDPPTKQYDSSALKLIDFCTVKEAAIILKISQSGVYYRIYREQIPTIWFGRQMLILKSDLL